MIMMTNLEIFLLVYLGVGSFWFGYDFYYLVKRNDIGTLQGYEFIGSRVGLILFWPIFLVVYISRFWGYYKQLKKFKEFTNDNK